MMHVGLFKVFFFPETPQRQTFKERFLKGYGEQNTTIEYSVEGGRCLFSYLFANNAIFYLFFC
jgi:hypothetical protein